MTDVWDIAQYVEAHPDNYRQRWRLAKKLYMAWEYRLALEHLLILKNAWEPRVNVSRYLAATYYRLSRYEDAIKELRDAIQRWPQELGLYEQLARTLAVGGRIEAAIEVWEEIAEIDPDHPFAKRAIEHLKATLEGEYAELGHAGANGKSSAEAPAETLGPNEVACPNCGQKNSVEFRRCWKCHAPLFEGPTEEASGAAKVEPQGIRWPLFTGIAIAALLALGVYLTLNGLGHIDAEELNRRVPVSASEFFTVTMLGTRILVGVLLLIGWPIAWRVAAVLAGVDDKVYNEVLYVSGGLLALTTYALLWLPTPWWALAAAVPFVWSALIAFFQLALRPKAAAGVWVGQFALAALLVVVAVVVRHGPGLFLELPAVLEFSARKSVPSVESTEFTAPRELQVRWQSSGAPWLDTHADKAAIHVAPGPHTGPMFLAIRQDSQELLFQPIRDSEYVHVLSAVQVGKDYTVEVRSREAVDVYVRVEGVLPVSVMVDENRPGPVEP